MLLEIAFLPQQKHKSDHWPTSGSYAMIGRTDPKTSCGASVTGDLLGRKTGGFSAMERVEE